MLGSLNSHPTSKSEADGTLIIFTPVFISAPLYRYLKLLKATRRGKKVKGGLEVTPGIGTWDLPHRRPPTNQLR